MAKFYVVSTPIGNMEDITARALRVLEEADLILCEDTRVTAKLLNKYEINTPQKSYHSQSGSKKVEEVISILKEGKDVALLSDSGTPSISDPGSVLVSTVKEEFEITASVEPEVEILSVPGPSAVTAALSVSGMPASGFLFLGFPPAKKARNKFFDEVADSKRTTVFYESPHRLIKSLKSLKGRFKPERRIVLVKEITKIYESQLEGSVSEVLEKLESTPDLIKGEFVVVAEGAK